MFVPRKKIEAHTILVQGRLVPVKVVRGNTMWVENVRHRLKQEAIQVRWVLKEVRKELMALGGVRV